jgi:hypothetical protein
MGKDRQRQEEEKRLAAIIYPGMRLRIPVHQALETQFAMHDLLSLYLYDSGGPSDEDMTEYLRGMLRGEGRLDCEKYARWWREEGRVEMANWDWSPFRSDEATIIQRLYDQKEDIMACR